MSMAVRSNKSALWLLSIANLVLPAAILTFAAGFFPYKPFIPGINYGGDFFGGIRVDPVFEKVVFIVVDALRSDFVYSEKSGFQYLQGLIRSGAALPFTAHATSPTITMPRVKAMTTGSIPSFVDVILNFAESDTTSTLADQDSWPLQLSLKTGGRLAMYGDDTWLKLFPSLFFRSDGTTSFFVSDFTEVDNNVTRHVSEELQNTDWNGIIMHYLGLDHIGHKSGPNSPNMVPKQAEMDGIVRQIYEEMTSAAHLGSTLLVLCGDHGMNDAGNHGGSAPGETSPALVFISPKFMNVTNGLPCPSPEPDYQYQYYTTVEQSDIVPTLAGLLGFPIPLNNLGVFIPGLLELWAHRDQKMALLRANAEQILVILRQAYRGISFDEEPQADSCAMPDSDGTLIHCKWTVARHAQEKSSPEASKALLEFIKLAQSKLSSAAANYDMRLLGLGTGLTALSAIASSLSLLRFGFSNPSSQLPLDSSLWFLFVTSSYGVTMFASSYIEEEHHYWHWIGSMWLFWLYLTRLVYRGSRPAAPLFAIAGLAASRVLRRWNQTGQKLIGNPDISKSFLPSHQGLLWTLVVLTYLYIGSNLVQYGLRARLNVFAAFTIITVLIALVFKIAFTQADSPELLSSGLFPVWVLEIICRPSLVIQARAVFTCLLVLSGMGFVKEKGGIPIPNNHRGILYIIDLLSLFLITQSRITNIPLILLFTLQATMIERFELSVNEISVSLLILQHAGFFSYGESNAISSIDLSNAYNGVSGYNAVAVGILTFVDNWAGPIWWSTKCSVLLINTTRGDWQSFQKHVCILTVFISASTLTVMVACTVFRSHLFIWTVFSPKYLFSIAWTIGHHIFVDILLCGALFQLANIASTRDSL